MKYVCKKVGNNYAVMDTAAGEVVILNPLDIIKGVTDMEIPIKGVAIKPNGCAMIRVLEPKCFVECSEDMHIIDLYSFAQDLRSDEYKRHMAELQSVIDCIHYTYPEIKFDVTEECDGIVCTSRQLGELAIGFNCIEEGVGYIDGNTDFILFRDSSDFIDLMVLIKRKMGY